MVSVLFVHGTGVREPSFSRTLGIIKKKMAECLPRTRVDGCYWGDLGAKLNFKGASIPEYSGARADTTDPDVAVWHLLDEDPLFELGVLANTAPSMQEVPPGTPSPGAKLSAHLDAVTPGPELRQQLEAFGYDEIWWQAFIDIRNDHTCRRAVEQSDEASGQTEHCIARAVAALAAIYASDVGLPALTAEQRDALVADMFAELRPSDYRGVTAWAKSTLSSLGLRILTRRLSDRKRSLTDIASPGGGDILLYQCRGQGIQSRIRAAITAQSEPVVLLTHSLGGVVCVDILCQDTTLPIIGLITVGSQSPYFYKIGALQGVELNAHLPVHFPRWLNVYDPNDLLSFIGVGIFGDRTTDLRVESGQPFPYAHSAYWSNEAVWSTIAEFCR